MTGKHQAERPAQASGAYPGTGAAQSIGEHSAGDAVRGGGVPPAAPPSPAEPHTHADPGRAGGVEAAAAPWLAGPGTGFDTGPYGVAGGAAGCAAPALADCVPMPRAPCNPESKPCAGTSRPCIAAAARWRERARWAARRADPVGFGSGARALCSGTKGTPPGHTRTAVVCQACSAHVMAGVAHRASTALASSQCTQSARRKHPCCCNSDINTSA